MSLESFYKSSRPSDAESDLILGLLQAIDQDAAASQRSLSNQLGIALGSVNWHLKRCIHKGLIKVQEAPLRRYAYYLTPQGFEEKSRLTLEYIRSSLGLFRRARSQFCTLFERAKEQGYDSTVLIGVGELSEAAVLSAAETRLNLVGVVVFDHPKKKPAERFAGLPISSSIAEVLRTLEVGTNLAVIVADIVSPEENQARAVEEVSSLNRATSAVFIPDMLRFNGPRTEVVDQVTQGNENRPVQETDETKES